MILQYTKDIRFCNTYTQINVSLIGNCLIIREKKLNYNIEIVSNTFDEDLIKLIQKSDIVLNLHYYNMIHTIFIFI